jgi:hypothetical protein
VTPAGIPQLPPGESASRDRSSHRHRNPETDRPAGPEGGDDGQHGPRDKYDFRRPAQ